MCRILNILVWPDFIGSVKTEKNAIPIYTENLKIEKIISSVQIVDPQYVALDGAPSDIELSEDIVFNYHVFCSGEDKYLQIELVPLYKKESRIFRLDSFKIEFTEKVNDLKSAVIDTEWGNSSVLSSGKWVKIKTSQQGIYKITYSDLQSWGFTDPSSVSVYGNGGYMLPEMNSEAFYDDLQQNAVLHGKDGSNSDCLFFYSTGTVKWAYDASKKMFVHQQNSYSDNTFYFLTDDGAGLSVQEEVKPATNPGKTTC